MMMHSAKQQSGHSNRCVNLDKAAEFFADHGKKAAKELRSKLQGSNFSPNWEEAEEMGCPPESASITHHQNSAPQPPAASVQQQSQEGASSAQNRPVHHRRADFWTRGGTTTRNSSSNQVNISANANSNNHAAASSRPTISEEVPEISPPPQNLASTPVVAPASANVVALRPANEIATSGGGGGDRWSVPPPSHRPSSSMRSSSKTLEAFASANQRLSGNCSTMCATVEALLDRLRIQQTELAQQAQEIERLKWSLGGAVTDPLYNNTNNNYGGYPPAGVAYATNYNYY